MAKDKEVPAIAIDKAKADFLAMLSATSTALTGADKTRLAGIVAFAEVSAPMDDDKLKLLRLDTIRALVEGGTAQTSAQVYANQINRVLRHFWADTKVNGVSFREIAKAGNNVNKVCAGLPKKGNSGRPAGKKVNEKPTALAVFLKGLMDEKIDQNHEGFQWAALNVKKAVDLLASAYQAEKAETAPPAVTAETAVAAQMAAELAKLPKAA